MGSWREQREKPRLRATGSGKGAEEREVLCPLNCPLGGQEERDQAASTRDFRTLGTGEHLQVSRDKNEIASSGAGNLHDPGPPHGDSGGWKERGAAWELVRRLVSTPGFHTHLKSPPGVGERVDFLRPPSDLFPLQMLSIHVREKARP